MNQRKIQELEQDLSADQRQSQQQAQAQRTIPHGRWCAAAPTLRARRRSCCAVAATTRPPRSRRVIPIADAEKALAFKARFASNLVSADDAASHPSAEPATARMRRTGSLCELAAGCLRAAAAR